MLPGFYLDVTNVFLGVLHGCYRSFTRELQGYRCFKVITGVLPAYYRGGTELLGGYYKGSIGVLQWCYRGIIGLLQGC